MATEASKLTQAFFQAKDVPCAFLDEEEKVLRVGWRLSGTNISIYMFFGDDNRYVSFEGRDFLQIPEEKKPIAYKLCNELNFQFRWVKFMVDEKRNELVAEDDAIIQLDSCGDEVFELMMRMTGIVEKAYPTLMKGLWA